jgi:hypothetical protein
MTQFINGLAGMKCLPIDWGVSGNLKRTKLMLGLKPVVLLIVQTGQKIFMKNDRYSMSFTTGSLFYRESVRLAALFVDLNDWNVVRNTVIADNLLQTRTLNTSKRFCREIISRLKTLSGKELELLMVHPKNRRIFYGWLFAADTRLSVILPLKLFGNVL